MFESGEIKRRIVERMPDASVEINDLTGGQDHYQVKIVSEAFEGMRAIQRHRVVYDLFSDVIGGALHALSLQTNTPGEEGS